VVEEVQLLVVEGELPVEEVEQSELEQGLEVGERLGLVEEQELRLVEVLELELEVEQEQELGVEEQQELEVELLLGLVVELLEVVEGLLVEEGQLEEVVEHLVEGHLFLRMDLG
jgi:hypothetical protein